MLLHRSRACGGRICQDRLGAEISEDFARGAVADVVESGGGVVSGLFIEPFPAFERRRRPRHERA